LDSYRERIRPNSIGNSTSISSRLCWRPVKWRTRTVSLWFRPRGQAIFCSVAPLRRYRSLKNPTTRYGQEIRRVGGITPMRGVYREALELSEYGWTCTSTVRLWRTLIVSPSTVPLVPRSKASPTGTCPLSCSILQSWKRLGFFFLQMSVHGSSFRQRVARECSTEINNGRKIRQNIGNGHGDIRPNPTQSLHFRSLCIFLVLKPLQKPSTAIREFPNVSNEFQCRRREIRTFFFSLQTRVQNPIVSPRRRVRYV